MGLLRRSSLRLAEQLDGELHGKLSGGEAQLTVLQTVPGIAPDA